MYRHKIYKHVFLVTNDLVTDRRMIRICNTLAETGVKVLLVGRERPESPQLDPQLFDQRRLRCFFSTGPLFYFEINIRMVILLFDIQFKTVTSVDLDTVLTGYWFNKWRKTITYFDANEYFTEVPELSGHPIKRRIWTWLGKWCLPAFDYRYTIGSALAEVLGRKYGCDFSVIRNVPTKTALPKLIKKEDIFTIVYLGVFHKGRGLAELIHAVSNLGQVQLLLLGEGDLIPELKQMAQLQQNIIFRGMIKPRDISNHLFRAHLGVNLLDTTSKSYYYSLANKFFDYINHGLPVLTMDFPEYRKINERYRCAHLVRSLEHEELVTSIKKLAEDKPYYDDLTNNTLKARKEFCWENEVAELDRIYKLRSLT